MSDLTEVVLAAARHDVERIGGDVVVHSGRQGGEVRVANEAARLFLLHAWDGARRNRPGPPHHVYRCTACNGLMIRGAQRAKARCPFCGATKSTEKIELRWRNLPKRPRKTKEET